MGDLGYRSTPNHDEPVSWQLEQPPVTPEWIIAPVGGDVLNNVPGTVALAFAGTGEFGLLPKWQFSQFEPLGTGMCDVAPGEPDGGWTIILLIP